MTVPKKAIEAGAEALLHRTGYEDKSRRFLAEAVLTAALASGEIVTREEADRIKEEVGFRNDKWKEAESRADALTAKMEHGNRLIKNLKQMDANLLENSKAWMRRAEKAEAKLNQAIEALTEIRGQGYAHKDAAKIMHELARAALDQLKEDK